MKPNRLVFLIILISAGFANAEPTEQINSYAELLEHYREESDFRISTTERRSSVLVAAIHGGNIEPGTSEIADLIAGGDHSLYKFESLLPEKLAWSQHITSTRFDEPRAHAMICRASTCVSVHGFDWYEEPGEREKFIVILGGRNEHLREHVKMRLTDFAERHFPGLKIVPGERARRFAGMTPHNIVNRPIQHGVQIEMSAGLRKNVFLVNQELALLFANTVRRAIDSYTLSGLCKNLL